MHNIQLNGVHSYLINSGLHENIRNMHILTHHFIRYR